MSVHRALGRGFPEVFYQRALAIEFEEKMVTFEREFEMPVFYLEKHIGTRRVDFLVFEKIAVELKATSELDDNHLTQSLNYLSAQNLEVGLLINFGSKSLQFKRLINQSYKDRTWMTGI
jgi:GxxExxY protein